MLKITWPGRITWRTTRRASQYPVPCVGQTETEPPFAVEWRLLHAFPYGFLYASSNPVLFMILLFEVFARSASGKQRYSSMNYKLKCENTETYTALFLLIRSSNTVFQLYTCCYISISLCTASEEISRISTPSCLSYRISQRSMLREFSGITVSSTRIFAQCSERSRASLSLVPGSLHNARKGSAAKPWYGLRNLYHIIRVNVLYTS